MCKEFVHCISDGLLNDLKHTLAKAEYYSILIHGSTDSGTEEKELMYILFVNMNGYLECRLLKLKNCTDGTAGGVKNLV